jgi:hypothetical protein
MRIYRPISGKPRSDRVGKTFEQTLPFGLEFADQAALHIELIGNDAYRTHRTLNTCGL